jgi:hypothetical protein
MLRVRIQKARGRLSCLGLSQLGLGGRHYEHEIHVTNAKLMYIPGLIKWNNNNNMYVLSLLLPKNLSPVS